MYVLFVNNLTKTYVLRYATGGGAYEPPGGNYDLWIVVDDSIEGFLDAVAVCRLRSRAEGWKNWDFKVEDCP